MTLPENEDENEWLAANTVDFFNEISLLYGLVADDALKFKDPGSGFPPGFEYRWMDEVKHKPVRCSSPEYVDYVMTWVEDQLGREDVFPIEEAHPFPEDFKVHVKDIFKRTCVPKIPYIDCCDLHMFQGLFRVFAIIYHRHFGLVEKLEAAAHLNTCFKHFMFFVFQFQLIDEKETKALKGPVDRMMSDFKAQRDDPARFAQRHS